MPLSSRHLPAVGGKMQCVGEGIWLTGCLLRSDECAAVIATAESEGFRLAHMKATGRNNSEVFFQLRNLSEIILARLRERGPGATGFDFEIVAMPPLLEFTAIKKVIMSRPIVTPPDDVFPDLRSDLSLVIYLNEAFQGGRHLFSGPEAGSSSWVRGRYPVSAFAASRRDSRATRGVST